MAVNIFFLMGNSAVHVDSYLQYSITLSCDVWFEVGPIFLKIFQGSGLKAFVIGPLQLRRHSKSLSYCIVSHGTIRCDTMRNPGNYSFKFSNTQMGDDYSLNYNSRTKRAIKKNRGSACSIAATKSSLLHNYDTTSILLSTFIFLGL